MTPLARRSYASLLRRHRGWAVALAIVVIAGAVAVVSIIVDRRGEHAVDATTVTATKVIPPPPATLGDKRFELSVLGDGTTPPVVVAAHPGFAVLVDNRLTSYGADGSERWHYRPASTAITDMHAYNGGTVLIAALAEGTDNAGRDERGEPPFPHSLVAFDANTGEQLWTSQRDDLRGAFAGYQNHLPAGQTQHAAPMPRYLAQSTGTLMLGFDARSGAAMWRESIGCSRTVYTPTQMVCLNVFGDHARAVVVDAFNGTRMAEWRIPLPEVDRPETGAFVADAAVANGAGVALTFWFSSLVRRIPAQSVYLNTTSGASVRLGAGDVVVTGGDPRGDLLVSAPDAGTTAVALHNPDGTQRCGFSPHSAPSSGEDGRTAWLRDQIIGLVDRDTDADPEQSLAVFGRDCRELASTPLPAGTHIAGMVPAPGVTVVIRSDDLGAHLDGYAPLVP